MGRADEDPTWEGQVERLLAGTTEMLSRHVEGLDAKRARETSTGTADVAKLTTAIAQFVRAAASVAMPSDGDSPGELARIFAEVDAEQGLA